MVRVRVATRRKNQQEKLLATLQQAEDWLYLEGGEDTTKSVYVKRLDTLKKIGDSISNEKKRIG